MNLLSQLRDYELRMRAEGKKAVPDDGEASSIEMPFMYALQNVRWEVRLRGDGSVRDVLPLSSSKDKGKDLGKPTPAPNLVRASGVRAKLLMDNAEYVLGLARKEGDKNTIKRHEAFKELIAACAEATDESSVQPSKRIWSTIIRRRSRTPI